MAQKNQILGTKYVPGYCANYFDNPWYEKDLMGYFNFLDYTDMSRDPAKYFEKKKVINFDIIHHKCRGDPLKETYEGYQTVKTKDLKNYPNPEKKEVVGGVIRNIKRRDLFVEKEVVNNHFKF